MIIEAVITQNCHFLDGCTFAVVWASLLLLYSTRLLFLVFHGESRVDKHTEEHLHETAPSITVPLILLAIPSVVIGYFTIEPMLFGGWLDNGIYIDTSHESVAKA